MLEKKTKNKMDMVSLEGQEHAHILFFHQSNMVEKL